MKMLTFWRRRQRLPRQKINKNYVRPRTSFLCEAVNSGQLAKGFKSRCNQNLRIGLRRQRSGIFTSNIGNSSTIRAARILYAKERAAPKAPKVEVIPKKSWRWARSCSFLVVEKQGRLLLLKNHLHQSRRLPLFFQYKTNRI